MKYKALFAMAASLALLGGSYASIQAAPPTARVVTPNAATVETVVQNAIPFNPIAPPQPEKGKIVNFTLEAKRAKLEVAKGIVKEVWTFNGSVPSPTLRVNQGDTVHFTLINKDPDMDHGLDFHAGQMDMSTFHKPIKPGESVSFDWVANYPGIFYYHCSAGPVITHIANGMFGAVIVDPPGYKAQGKEYVLIQNEWYKNLLDLDALKVEDPEFVTFNGVANQYVDNPLPANPGENVRYYFVNAGINHFSAWHVIGTIFDKVFMDGNPANKLLGVQTVTIPPGGAAVTDLVADTGSYAMLTHSMKDAYNGALGILKVGEATAQGHDAASHGNAELTPSKDTAAIPAPTSPSASPAAGHEHASQETAQPAAGDQIIHQANFAFNPKALTVKLGTKVTFVNDEDTLHTVVSDLFDSRKDKSTGFGKGESYSYTFDKSGEYKVKCAFHPFMTTTITVK